VNIQFGRIKKGDLIAVYYLMGGDGRQRSKRIKERRGKLGRWK
jgi:hypothetical protein